VQDAASTDRTTEIVKDYGFDEGYVCEPDNGTLDGLIRAAKRCSGEFIVPCWADDELLPHALGWAAEYFKIYNTCGVIYGDPIVVDELGGTKKINYSFWWDFDKFYRQHFVPNFSSSFFKREALVRLSENVTTFDHDE